MPTLQDNYQKFSASLSASNALYRHCISPLGPHTKAGIEAAFLQIQKSWELFLEDFLLLILTGENPSTSSVNVYFTVSNIEIARKILLQEKRYVEWTNKESINKRFGSFMDTPNHIEGALNTISSELSEITKIRNFIAHSSKSAKDDFNDLCVRKLGGSPSIGTAADFLQLADRSNPPDTYFERYSKVLDISALIIIT